MAAGIGNSVVNGARFVGDAEYREKEVLPALKDSFASARTDSVRPKARWGYYNYPGSCDQPWDVHMPSKIGELCNDNYHRLAPIGEAQNAVSHKAASCSPIGARDLA